MIVVNSCAVTTSAERQARQAIRKIHRAHPDADIIVTGCASEIAPDAYRALPGVTRIVPNREKLQAAQWASAPVGCDLPEVPGSTSAPFFKFSKVVTINAPSVSFRMGVGRHAPSRWRK